MELDMKQMPFSRRGSYMALGYHEGMFQGQNLKEGLYLRTVHGMAKNPVILRIVPLWRGKPVQYGLHMEPERLCMSLEHGKVILAFDDSDTLLASGEGDGTGIRCEMVSEGIFEMAEPVMDGKERWYLINHFGSYTRYMIWNQEGELSVDQEWKISKAAGVAIEVSETEGRFLLVLEEVADSWYRKKKKYDINLACQDAKKDFEAFYGILPSVPERFRETGKKAAYVNWSSIVRKKGFLKRDAMFMSKNWMCNVWSWDHCFNAMALSYGDPKQAWDQFMILFDCQTESGRIPDSINDSLVIDNYCKPPIHGWTYRQLKKHMRFDEKQKQEIYDKLSAWTGWWLNFRDQDGDGLCEYTHGNDSGWDNSTAFCQLPPVTTPDLAAFLMIQMEELALTAGEIGMGREAKSWRAQAEKMKAAMLDKLFLEGYPTAVQTLTGDKIENESLLLYLPVILAEELPENIRINLINEIKDHFATEYGLATERPDSIAYESDGYWRGPIWAPSTILIADGLWRCGEKAFVRKLTENFCKLVERSGCAENFDALTGEGLRDRAYTWTSSIMLVMAHEFLEEDNIHGQE